MRSIRSWPLYPPVWFLLQLGLAWSLARWTESSLPFALPAPRLLGTAFGLAGAALTIWAIFTVQRARTPVLPYRQPETLLTRGPFRLSRNPIYLGEAFILTGVALRCGESLPWLPLPLFLIGLTLGPVRWEERALRDRFGATYHHYCQTVRRWI